MDEANSIQTRDEANSHSIPMMMEVNQGAEEGFASNQPPPMTESTPAVVTSQEQTSAADQLPPLPSQKKRKPIRKPSEGAWFKPKGPNFCQGPIWKYYRSWGSGI
ncbi:hypothetical protein Pyn_03344 [Prunus yedoensis var. nudiflora]|uniref:Uncharacterized protein n=1 Tax=Prunus yedoensis var. nudiflora TaxID=2094558 RepID=A0A314ZIH4_PRUYE|nr:hypothetical protein Pyn_03344 [Prunus yedoensis var. nudiflora]